MAVIRAQKACEATGLDKSAWKMRTEEKRSEHQVQE